ncbi:MadB family AAA-type ATPase [Actinomycetospora sp. CA-084318]|uniref:MadB family AAA-type ATPase n=1 Tax=Actinomycetospora sp. CA-084318 TaxID=3239892 RepID=UPI003D99118E
MPAIESFPDAEQVRATLETVDYVVDPDLAVVVLLATRLDRPLLLEGPAGVGKTELAKSLAASTGRTLVRLQCYEGLDDGRVLYEWDYGKQLLHVQMLRDRIGALVADAPDLNAAAAILREQDAGLYTEHFLAVRPLLEAILSEEPVVLLVDEVDRTDESVEALLLEILAEGQVTIPEIGTFVARSRPWVVLTSNDTRELTPALKRRCLHHHLDFPTAEREAEIVGRRAPEVDATTAAEVVDLANRLRAMPLRKAPSISEVVDAARAALVLGGVPAAEDTDSPLLATLLKYGTDREVARDRLGAPAEDPVPDDGSAPAERARVATAPRNTTTAAFRGHGGRDRGRSDNGTGGPGRGPGSGIAGLRRP